MDFNLYFKSRQAEMVSLLKQLVSRESPSLDKRAVDACTSFALSEFRKIGGRVVRFPQKRIGDLHVVEYPGTGKFGGEKPFLILTHIDTVWPVGKIAEMPFYISGEKVYGPGVLDMKAGLVMAISALKAFHQLNLRPRRRIVVFINTAEEIGHEEAHEMIRQLAKKSAYVLCLEPALPGGALKTRRKGRLVVRLEAKGKAAHAGTPEKGANAIEEIITQVHRLKRLAKSGITMSLNQIGGGEKANIVAESAWAILDIRFWNGVQKDRIMAALRQARGSVPGARLKHTVESFTPPMEKTKPSFAFFQQVRQIASAMELTLEEGKTGGGSDASIASSLGVPTLDGLGPDGDGIHAVHEHLLLPSLVQRTALLTEILRQI
ncbi:MAG: M20 family metallopeptidase [Candidatus Aminicenantales bacterium]